MTRSFKLPRRSMLLALACTLVGTTALAQDPFPSKSIRIVAAGAPGGGRVAAEQVAGHGVTPCSGTARMACGGHCATQIRQPLQCS